MGRQITILGAGMVGVSIAAYLRARGHDITLIDRKAPGRETSFGNAGLIQREAVAPYPFPRDVKTLCRVLPNKSGDIRYSLSAVLKNIIPLAQYWRNSNPRKFAHIVPEYASLIMHSTAEHDRMIKAARAEYLISRKGWLDVFHTRDVFEREQNNAREFNRRFGVTHRVLEPDMLQKMEPELSPHLAGAIHWTCSWTAFDPGALVTAYADWFVENGGTFEQAEAKSLIQTSNGWRVETNGGPFDSEVLVIAAGPWSKGLLDALHYRLPLFVERGYHMHYSCPQGKALNHDVCDFEKGYVLSPKLEGLRLATGAELNTLSAPPRYGQLEIAETQARNLFPLGERKDATPWMGGRPCLPDMKPVIGPSLVHRNLWLAFGHAHQGFTLGPVTGRLISEMIDGETPFVDPHPFRADRF